MLKKKTSYNSVLKIFIFSLLLLGVSIFTNNQSVQAETMTSCPENAADLGGKLIKVPHHTAVYYINAKELKRYYFPNSEVYHTWYDDFSDVIEIPASCIDNYPSGGGINYRPGTFLVGSAVSPNIYAIGTHNLKHLIQDEAHAESLYGKNWASKVRILPDYFMANLIVPSDETNTKAIGKAPHDGMVIKKQGEDTVYHVRGNKYYELELAEGETIEHTNEVTPEVFNLLPHSNFYTPTENIFAHPSQRWGGFSWYSDPQNTEEETSTNEETSSDDEELYRGDCTTEECVNAAFESCTPTTFEILLLENFGLVYEYDILGIDSASGKCEIKNQYTEHPEPDFTNRDMTCLYDNTLDINSAAEDILDNIEDVCTGTLVEKLNI